MTYCNCCFFCFLFFVDFFFGACDSGLRKLICHDTKTKAFFCFCLQIYNLTQNIQEDDLQHLQVFS